MITFPFKSEHEIDMHTPNYTLVCFLSIYKFLVGGSYFLYTSQLAIAVELDSSLFSGYSIYVYI